MQTRRTGGSLVPLLVACSLLLSSAPARSGQVTQNVPNKGLKIHTKNFSPADCVSGQIVVAMHQGADTNESIQAIKDLNGTIIQTTSAGDLSFALIQVTAPQKNWSKAITELSKDKAHFDQVQLNNHYYHLEVRPGSDSRKQSAVLRSRVPQTPTPPAPSKPTSPQPAPPSAGSTSGWPSSGTPNDPDLSQQTQLFVHNVVAAQESLYKKKFAMPINGAVSIGVIDTGVQASLSSFAAGQVAKGYNAWTGGAGNVDSDVGSTLGHGTFNAALMAAKTNDDIQGAGILPGATIVPVDVFNGQSSTDTFHIISAIQWIQKNAPAVKFVNLSLNGTPPNTLNADSAYQSVVSSFYNSKQNGTVFNAAGNDGLADNSSVVPGNVCVEAVDSTLTLASFANFGTAIQLAGLGVNDGSTNKLGQFEVSDGSSFATPVCCAIAAAVQYQYKLTAAQTLALMKAHASSTSNGVPLPDMNRCVNGD